MLQQQLKLSYENPEVSSDPVLQESMIDEMLDAVFLTSTAPVTAKSPAQRHLLASKAVHYLKDNVQGVVTLRAMCEHVGVSERLLRQGFLERYGVTPKTYIKYHRLYKLHELLGTSIDENLSVTQAALGLGLTHLGRLSSEYRVLFGEFPSKTLKRTPACTT